MCLVACTRDVLETGPDGGTCIDPASLSHRQYAWEGIAHTETSVKLSFLVPGFTSHEARLSDVPYQADAVAEALRENAATHPKAVTPALGGLMQVDAWYDSARSTPQHPVLAHAPAQGWYLVEPKLLEKGGDEAFLAECPTAA